MNKMTLIYVTIEYVVLKPILRTVLYDRNLYDVRNLMGWKNSTVLSD